MLNESFPNYDINTNVLHVYQYCRVYHIHKGINRLRILYQLIILYKLYSFKINILKL